MDETAFSPFTSYGPWKLPIGSDAVYEQPGVAKGYAVLLSSWEEPDLWSIPVYQASAQAPLRPVLYNIDTWNKVASGEWLRAGNSPAVEKEILRSSSPGFPMEGNVFSSQSATGWVLPQVFNRLEKPAQSPVQFRLPDDAVPPMGWDGHIAVYQPDGSVFEAYGVIQLSTGERVALTYNVTDPKSHGDGFQNGVTASMLPVYGGLTTQEEILSGRIDHAMKLYAPPAVLHPSYAYPALAFDRDAMVNEAPYSGGVPMGGRLAIPAGRNLDDLDLMTPEGKAIAEAAQIYGFIIADRGGSGFTVLVEQDHKETPLDTWSWSISSDLEKIFAQLHVVQNGSVKVADPTPAVARVPVSGGDRVVGTVASEIFHADQSGQVFVGGGGHDIFDVGNFRNVTITVPETGVTTLVSRSCTVELPQSLNNLKAEGDCPVRIVKGNAGHNDIDPGDGHAAVFAGAGNDVIRLGSGKYTVSGGPGHDIFRFESPENQGAVIIDFTVGQDRLDLTEALRAIGYSGRDPLKDGVLRFQHEGGGKVSILLDKDGAGPLEAHTLATLERVEAEALVANHDWFF